jgi:hypothetical protein
MRMQWRMQWRWRRGWRGRRGRRVGGVVEWWNGRVEGGCGGARPGPEAEAGAVNGCQSGLGNQDSGISVGRQGRQGRALGQGRHSGEGRCIKTRPPGRRRQAGEGRTSGAGAGAGMDAGAAASSELGGLWAVGWLWAGFGRRRRRLLSSSAGPPGAGARQGSPAVRAHWLRRARWCHGDGYGHFPKPAIDEVQARFFRRPDIRACIGAPTHVFWRKNRVYSPKARCWVYWRGESTGGRPGWHGAPRA